jgi:aminoglycoside phosphotransferase (APT) family kinase protein
VSELEFALVTVKPSRRLTAEIITRHSEALPASAEPIRSRATKVTSTGVVVVMVGPRDAEPCAVIKLARTAPAVAVLRRETAVLTALHAQPGLGSWRELMPQPYADGELSGYRYRIDSALPGRLRIGRSPDHPGWRHLLRQAAEAIAVLHRQTATVVDVNAKVLKLWVDAPLHELSQLRGRDAALARRLRRLHDELYEALVGHRLSAGWIHGDYWLGNLLFAGSDPSLTALRGIVDWETAAAAELALHDLLHLVLYTRRLQGSREFGDVICEQLRRPRWSAEERRVLGDHPGWGAALELGERHALLLYWLRHVAIHLRQQESPDGWRCRWWQARNVVPVLGLLWP